MNSHPTIREELERKTINCLVELEEKKQSEEITYFEYCLAKKAIYDVISGLVSKEIIELLSYE